MTMGRISIDLPRRRLSEDATRAELSDTHSHLSAEDVRDSIAYAAAAVSDAEPAR